MNKTGRLIKLLSTARVAGVAASLGLLCIAYSPDASASILNLQIGSAQIFDVQYNWSSTTNNPNCGYSNSAACDTLNVSGLQAPYESVPNNFTHPTLTTGQYYGFINSPTVSNTFGLAVFNSNGTESYAIDNTGTLAKLSTQAIFYIGNNTFGTLITPNAGYAYGSSAQLSVGNGTPTNNDALAFVPPSNTPLGTGETVSTPEPASVVLLGGALAGLGMIRRRRR